MVFINTLFYVIISVLTVFGFICLLKMIIDTVCMKNTNFSFDIHINSVYDEEPERVLRILESTLSNSLLLSKTNRIILKKSALDKETYERLKKEFPNIFLTE